LPRKPKKPCRYPGCPALTAKRYCSEHQRQVDKEYNRNHRPYKKLYNSARWQRLRKWFLSKHPLCTECERQTRITPATVVDHIKPHQGDPELFWDENNLQALCKPCHDRKTAREDGRWGKKGVVYSYR
jgi:5-methylcytosine-specific restriction protein A